MSTQPENEYEHLVRGDGLYGDSLASYRPSNNPAWLAWYKSQWLQCCSTFIKQPRKHSLWLLLFHYCY